jgi:late competence protein required for DNA uptake (superfamily II DNA/RNA helicase)
MNIIARQLIPGGIQPSDHVHRRKNDMTCSRCRSEIAEDEVPLMLWLNAGEDMLIYCERCLGVEREERR